MRIIIVDDEPFIRVSFKSYIDWTKYGLKLVGEAGDGEEALRVIDDLKPDLVFLDIKMPRLDGISVLRLLKERGQVPKVIVLSSYNEFEYVREAMKLGALDYIHKPGMNVDGLIAVIMNVKSVLDDEREKLSEYNNIKKNVEQNRLNLKALFFKELADGLFKNPWEVDEKVRFLDIKLKNSNLFCMAISIDNYKTIEKRYRENKQHVLDLAIKNIIEELFGGEEEFEFFQHCANTYIVLKSYSKLRSLREIQAHNEFIIKTLREALKQFLNISATTGVSNMHRSITELPCALKEAIEAVRYIFFDTEKNTIFYYKSINYLTSGQEDNGVENLGRFYNELVDLLDMDDINGVKASFEKIVLYVLKKRDCSEKIIKNLFVDIRYIFSDKFRKICISNDNDCILFPAEDILSAENLIQIKSLFYETFNQLNRLICENKEIHTGNSKIKETIDYIHQNYKNDISLEAVSEAVFLNSSYLSRLFRNETGMTLTYYINKCRIESAMKHLRKESAKSYEVAETVGFQNVEYFNITFKKFTGKTPIEYRKAFLE